MNVELIFDIYTFSLLISLFILRKSIYHLGMIHHFLRKLIHVKLLFGFKIIHAAVEHVYLVAFIHHKLFLHFITYKQLAHAHCLFGVVVAISIWCYLQKIVYP